MNPADGVVVRPAPSLALLTVGATVIGDALRIHNGSFDLLSLSWIALSFALCLLALFEPRFAWQRWLDDRFPSVLAACIGYLAYRQCVTEVSDMHKVPAAFALAVSATCLYFSVRQAGNGRLWFAASLLAWCMTGAILLRTVHPDIDVIVVHQDAARAMLHGENPIALTFALPEGQDVEQARRFYKEGELVNGRINWGYPYPPLSLLLVLPAYALTGDYRFAMLTALALAAWICGTHREGRTARLAPMLLLYSPVTWFVLEQGWTEPLLILLLSAVVVAALRFPRWTPVLFGLFLCVKQYLAPLLLAMPALMRGFHVRKMLWMMGAAAMVAAVTIVPFYFWNPEAFLHTYLHGFPVRRDALSFNSILVRLGVNLPGLVLGIPAIGVALLLARRVPLTPSGFALSAALFFFAVFLFAQVAFCNYYYFIAGALCISIATAEEVGSRR